VKRAFYTIALAAMTGASLVGCNNKKTSSIPASESVADVTPTPAPAPMPAYQPAPQPVNQPVVYDSVQPTQASAAGAIGGGSYTVKKGDTLYSIARARYGDGKQWSRITAANPGLRPESLKVGQTITIP
jgi:nucleoid-associated protein YgaU